MGAAPQPLPTTLPVGVNVSNEVLTTSFWHFKMEEPDLSIDFGGEDSCTRGTTLWVSAPAMHQFKCAYLAKMHSLWAAL